MATKKTTTTEVTTKVNKESKMSIKDKISNSKAVRLAKANWKPFVAGAGTATGIGLLTYILKKATGSAATPDYVGEEIDEEVLEISNDVEVESEEG